jgi:polyhydroxyalkanoate synthesis regulator phasin
MGIVVQKYEKQIQGMQDQLMRHEKTSAETLKRTVDELQRAHKVSIDQLEAKNRDRMRTITSHQQEEIRSVNKRHEDKLDAVLTEVKKT